MDDRKQKAGQAGTDSSGLATLALLMAPARAESFFARYYDEAPLHCPRDDPGRYAHLLTLEAVDAFIDGADLRHGMVELIRDGRRVPAQSFTSADGRIIASAVVEHYLHGGTIALPQLQESLAPLGELCRALESLFSCHVQANAYLTPGGRSGFAPHEDSHDVFVLQIHGAKAWRLYERAPPSAFRGDFAPPADADDEPTKTLNLHPGDCLYLPRGWVHAAANEGEAPSLHITIGLLTRTWADLLLTAAAEAARTDPAFARPLPPGFARANFDPAAEQEFARLAQKLASAMSMAPALDLLSREFLHGRRPKVAGVIASGSGVPRRGATYRRRPLVPWRLSQAQGELVLTGPGGDLRFPARDGEALTMTLSGDAFRVEDLPCPAPERLFRTLWAGGYLEQVQA